MLEFYHVKYPKARKEHLCDLCDSLSQVDERYLGKLDCEKIIDAFLDENGDDEYSDDEIYDWLTERFCYNCKHGWHRDDALDDCTVDKFCCPIILAEIKK